MGLTLITPATSAPVALADLKLVCRVEDSSFDAELVLHLASAHAALSEWLGSPLGIETWQLTLDGFAEAIELPKGPALAVSAFSYVDQAGAPVAVPGDLYTLDLVSNPQWIVRNADANWPTPLVGVNVVSVTFTAGYDATTLPKGLKNAVLALAKHWFESGIDAGMPNSVTDLAAPWRRLWIAA